MKTSLNGEGNNNPNPRNPESPKQDKPKAKHPKTHINQINKNQTQRTNIKSSKGKITNNTQVPGSSLGGSRAIQSRDGVSILGINCLIKDMEGD